MDRQNINKCLCAWYAEKFAKTTKGGKIVPNYPSNPHVVPLLEKLTGAQLEQLQNGSGNPIAEMYQINSSAGLVVNFFKLFELTHKGVVVEFEWNESIPLKDSPAPANIDAKYEIEDTIYFIEGKFLEPYCDNAKPNSKSYKDTSRYPFDDNKEEWLSLLNHDTEFKYFDYAQLCRHLLAIYRHTLENPTLYQNKRIVLQSLCWQMTNRFQDKYKELELPVKDMEDRCIVLADEKRRASKYFNDFLKEIGWEQCTFETKSYNERINDIKESPSST